MSRFLLALQCLALTILAPLSVLAQDKPTPASTAADAELVEARREVPRLKPPAAYEPADNTVVIELSEYAGYSGLIAANNGLEPNTDSYFFKKHKFKVKINLSEEESWSALNSGRMAASATTVDVLAAYGKQFEVVVPALIGFSRGADGVVVRDDIKSVNDLKGKVLSACQFTESDFFIRFLAQEAGLAVNLLDDFSVQPDPDKINLIACGDGFGAGDIFLRDLKSNRTRLAGAVTWAPKTTEVAEGSGGKARVLVTNRNLLIVADILVVNRGFAKKHPEMVAALVDGLIAGNQMVRSGGCLPLIRSAFKWDEPRASAELAKVHLANLPENIAFFDGTIDSAGSYGYIFESTVGAYGRGFVPKPADPDGFLGLAALKALRDNGAYADQRAQITPIKTVQAQVEDELPLLSKDIRFLFEPNVAKLDLKNEDSVKNLETIAKVLQVSPGSHVRLVGHADPTLKEKYRREGGETMVRQVALAAIQLTKDRATEIGRLLTEKYGIDPARIQTSGRGWDEPVSDKMALNRCVEMQLFTVE